jgi:hypothetical protein
MPAPGQLSPAAPERIELRLPGRKPSHQGSHSVTLGEGDARSAMQSGATQSSATQAPATDLSISAAGTIYFGTQETGRGA